MKKSSILTVALNVLLGVSIVYAIDVLEDKQPEKDPVECLALNIYFESRSESLAGQIAVANVTMNRVESEKFPDDVCKVVYDPYQFSWVHLLDDHDTYERETYKEIYKLADLVYNVGVPDITEGSLFYHADYIDPPVWTKAMEKVVQIDQHIFYKVKE